MSVTNNKVLTPPIAESFESRRIRAVSLKAILGSRAPDLMKVGRYRLIRPLGDGGQGSVYLAEDPVLGRKVALKMLHRGVDGESHDLLEEAQALALVDHPNVVMVHDFGESAHAERYFVMELVEGTSLKAWSTEQSRSWREVLDVLIAVGHGLAAVHERGIVHRDVKPENVMLTEGGVVKLVDLGVALRPMAATVEGSELDDAETAAIVAGTLPYLPPEVFEGGAQDELGDQYGFCATFHRALTQRLPPRRIDSSSRPSGGSVDEALAVSGGVPRSLLRVLEKGLSPNPRDRFDSMDELVAALEGVRRERARRRSRLVTLGVGLGVVASVGLTVVIAGQSTRLPCEKETSLSERWAAQREQIRDDFFSTKAPRAGVEFESFDEFSTLWADEHAAAYEEACEALSSEGVDYSRALSHLACLDEARGVFEGVMTQMSELSSGDVPKISERMRELPLLAACTEPTRLEVCAPGQVTEGFEEQSAEIERLLQAAESRILLAKYQEGIELTEEALALAERAGLEPLQVRSLLVQGRLAYSATRLEEAFDVLERAQSLAETNECDLTSAEISTLLAKIAALKRTRTPDEAKRWSQAALDKVARLGIEGERKADALNSRGLVLHFLVRDYEGADAYYRDAAEIREGLLPGSATDLADTLLNRGVALGRLGRNDDAITQLQRAYELRATALGEDHPSLFKIHASLSDRYLAMDELELAEREGRRSVALAEGFGDSVKLAQQHTRLARVLARARKLDEAIEESRRTLEILGRVAAADDIRVLDAWGTLGQLLLDSGKPEEARGWLEKHYVASKDHPDMDELHRAIVAYRLAELEMSISESLDGEPALVAATEALARYDDAQRWLGSDPRLATHVLNAHVGYGKGRALRASGRDEDAMNTLRAALGAWESSSGSNPEREALTRWELAQSLCTIAGRRTEALEQARQALDYYAAQSDDGAISHASKMEEWIENDGCR